MKLPWAKTPEPLYMPAPTVTTIERERSPRQPMVDRVPPPEPDDEGDVLWERDEPVQLRPLVPNAIDGLRAEYARAVTDKLRSPWRREPPIVPGLYWWRPYPLGDLPPDLAALELVVDYGGKLAITAHKGDSVTYRSLSLLPSREWVGPIGVPDSLDLEKWWGIKC